MSICALLHLLNLAMRPIREPHQCQSKIVTRGPFCCQRVSQTKVERAQKAQDSACLQKLRRNGRAELSLPFLEKCQIAKQCQINPHFLSGWQTKSKLGLLNANALPWVLAHKRCALRNKNGGTLRVASISILFQGCLFSDFTPPKTKNQHDEGQPPRHFLTLYPPPPANRTNMRTRKS